MEIMSRNEAKLKGMKWYFTGKPCKYGHIDYRQVSSKGCKSCQKIAFADWESKNLAKRAEEKRNRREANSEHFRILAKARRDSNPDKTKEQAKNNYIRNKHLFISANKRRKIILARNSPIWSDNAAINEIYKVAARMTKETGIPHHVDHIVPLQGKLVSGLHVAHNLRVITAKENLSKGNKWQS